MSSFLMHAIYNIAQLVSLPFLLLWLLYRKGVQGKGEGWSERLGKAPLTRKNEAAPIWIHAVSAGEAAAAAPLARALRKRFPEVPLVLSTLTPAGREMATRVCPEVQSIFYYPWDTLFSVERALRRVRPRAVILMEAEIWPNFLARCRARGIPVGVVNGRISDKGYRRARRFERVIRWAYGMVAAFGMQTSEDAARARALGAPPDRVKVLGQTKFDQEAGPLSPRERAELRRELGLAEEDRALVGGSTRPGEEEALAATLKALRPDFPHLKLLIAPRHLERLDEIAALLEREGLSASRRSSSPDPGAEVLLLDTMGELGKMYAVGEVCFVGGTLANIGGHNLLQPVAQGKPVLFGPHTQNVRDLADLLIQAGVGFQVRDGAELTQAVREALSEPEAWRDLEHRALHVVDSNKGASERYAELVAAMLEGK